MLQGQEEQTKAEQSIKMLLDTIHVLQQLVVILSLLCYL